MSILKELLQHLSKVPYNSVRRDLPDTYDGDQWGLDCFGFVKELSAEIPETKPIMGTYAAGILHAAAIINQEFVDPFVRMVEGMPITANAKRGDTYYADVSITAQKQDDDLVTTLSRSGREFRKYRFPLVNQDYSVPNNTGNHGYKYTVLHKGLPISIVKHGSGVEVIGTDLGTANNLLNSRYGLGINDVEAMFRDAYENSRYQKCLARNEYH